MLYAFGGNFCSDKMSQDYIYLYSYADIRIIRTGRYQETCKYKRREIGEIDRKSYKFISQFLNPIFLT